MEQLKEQLELLHREKEGLTKERDDAVKTSQWKTIFADNLMKVGRQIDQDTISAQEEALRNADRNIKQLLMPLSKENNNGVPPAASSFSAPSNIKIESREVTAPRLRAKLAPKRGKTPSSKQPPLEKEMAKDTPDSEELATLKEKYIALEEDHDRQATQNNDHAAAKVKFEFQISQLNTLLRAAKEEIKAKVDELTEELNEVKEERDDLRKEVDELIDDQNDKKIEISQLDEDLVAAHAKNNKLEAQARESEAVLAALRQEVAEVDAKIKLETERADVAEHSLDEAIEELEAQGVQLDELAKKQMQDVADVGPLPEPAAGRPLSVNFGSGKARPLSVDFAPHVGQTSLGKELEGLSDVDDEDESEDEENRMASVAPPQVLSFTGIQSVDSEPIPPLQVDEVSESLVAQPLSYSIIQAQDAAPVQPIPEQLSFSAIGTEATSPIKAAPQQLSRSGINTQNTSLFQSTLQQLSLSDISVQATSPVQPTPQQFSISGISTQATSPVIVRAPPLSLSGISSQATSTIEGSAEELSLSSIEKQATSPVQATGEPMSLTTIQAQATTPVEATSELLTTSPIGSQSIPPSPVPTEPLSLSSIQTQATKPWTPAWVSRLLSTATGGTKTATTQTAPRIDSASTPVITQDNLPGKEKEKIVKVPYAVYTPGPAYTRPQGVDMAAQTDQTGSPAISIQETDRASSPVNGGFSASDAGAQLSQTDPSSIIPMVNAANQTSPNVSSANTENSSGGTQIDETKFNVTDGSSPISRTGSNPAIGRALVSGLIRRGPDGTRGPLQPSYSSASSSSGSTIRPGPISPLSNNGSVGAAFESPSLDSPYPAPIAIYRTLDPIRGWLQVYLDLWRILVSWWDTGLLPADFWEPRFPFKQYPRDGHIARVIGGTGRDASKAQNLLLQPPFWFNIAALFCHFVVYGVFVAMVYVMHRATREQELWLGANDLTRVRVAEMRTGRIRHASLTETLFGEITWLSNLSFAISQAIVVDRSFPG